MKESLKPILKIQELDMNMIRLMGLKQKRQAELENIYALQRDLDEQFSAKQNDILEIKKNIRLGEGKIQDVREKIQRLEAQQSMVKKVDEFNALSQELTSAERERIQLEQQVSEAGERLAAEEEVLTRIQESLNAAKENSRALEREILESIAMINKEGQVLQQERNKLSVEASPDLLRVYERLLSNKKDRVVVPIEHRTCSGCHIVLTAQHENLVRKGEKLVFCEHCSRIHYWQESEAPEEEAAAPTKRRRRRVSA